MSDLIKRADAIEAVVDFDSKQRIPTWIYNGLIADIHALPSADAVSREDLMDAYERGLKAQVVNLADRPHGEWQMCEDDDGIYGNCSVCGCDADFSHYCKAFDFCPNCGADMRTDYTDAFNEQFGDALEKLDKLTLKGGGE